ncbi:MAG TPA: PAC2 family protein [Kineosporiaceae bacterium]|nr:PAC2 family protein [Kineosporiaceae bacterium]
MLDPDALYEPDAVQPQPGELERPVLLHALGGFVDAGQAGRLAAEHLLATLPHRVLVRFDVDQIYDYRARRPVMTFVEDHWESYDTPRLELSLVEDAVGTGFLMLTGPEPDVQWERFTTAVRSLVERYGVRLTVGVHAIPMAVPHTRPVGVTAHATRAELIAGHEPWVTRVQVPGHMAGLLEFRLGEAGFDAAGFAVHVPHYLAQAEYPDAAATLVEAVAEIGDLRLPVGDLRAAGEQVRAAVDAQVAEQPEVAEVVRALEEQYDAFVAARGRSLLARDSPLPTAEELGAELERFLAQENDRRGRGNEP